MALGALGWPILQGALSTIFGVIVLSTVEAYMIVTFFKTVFLVIAIGAIHGLIFLPVLLSIFVRGTCIGRKKPMVKTDKVHPRKDEPTNYVIRERQKQQTRTESPATSEETEDAYPIGPGGRYGIHTMHEPWLQPVNPVRFQNGNISLGTSANSNQTPVPYGHPHPSKIHLVPSSQSINVSKSANGHPVFFIPDHGLRLVSSDHSGFCPPTSVAQTITDTQMRRKTGHQRRFSTIEDTNSGMIPNPSPERINPQVRRHSAYEYGSSPGGMPNFFLQKEM